MGKKELVRRRVKSGIKDWRNAYKNNMRGQEWSQQERGEKASRGGAACPRTRRWTEERTSWGERAE